MKDKRWLWRKNGNNSGKGSVTAVTAGKWSIVETMSVLIIWMSKVPVVFLLLLLFCFVLLF